MYPLERLRDLLEQVMRIDQVVRAGLAGVA
jgi:hypothetical protein